MLLLHLPPERRKPRDRRPDQIRHSKRGSQQHKFLLEILRGPARPSRHTAEDELRRLAQGLGFTLLSETQGFRITYTGRRNGMQGAFWPDFVCQTKTGDVYLEVSMGADLAEKEREITLVRDKYGYQIIHVTPEMMDQLRANPAQLTTMVAEVAARQAEAVKFFASIHAAWVERKAEQRRARRETTNCQPKPPAKPGRGPSQLQLSARSAA